MDEIIVGKITYFAKRNYISLKIKCDLFCCGNFKFFFEPIKRLFLKSVLILMLFGRQQ